MDCFERLLRFLNKHAYIEVVLRNLSFCSASYKSASVLTNNFLRVGTLTTIVELFLIMGTFLISFLSVFIGYYLLEWYGSWRNEEFDTIGPLVIIFLIGFFIS